MRLRRFGLFDFGGGEGDRTPFRKAYLPMFYMFSLFLFKL